MSIALFVLGVVMWFISFVVFATAPTASQEGIGVLIAINGSVLFGSGAIVRAVSGLRDGLKIAKSAVPPDESQPPRELFPQIPA